MKHSTWAIAWNDGMSVGIPEIDEDHKRFILLINELNNAILNRENPDEVRRRLQIVIDDAKRHFSQEEKLFQIWLYPELDDHTSKHKRILNAMQEIKAKFITYDFNSTWKEAGLKIKETLIDHILNEDMKYAKFYRNSKHIGYKRKGIKT